MTSPQLTSYSTENVKTFSPRSGTNRMPLSPLLFSLVLESLARAMRQGKEMKSIQIGKVRLSVFADGMLLSVKSQASINRRLDEENTVYINKSKKSRNLRQYGQTERASREANKSTSLRERQTLYDLVCVCVCVCVCACMRVHAQLYPTLCNLAN